MIQWICNGHYEKMKNDVKVSNDPVQLIIRDSNEELDEEAASRPRSISSLTQMLNRKKLRKTKLFKLLIPRYVI